MKKLKNEQDKIQEQLKENLKKDKKIKQELLSTEEYIRHIDNKSGRKRR